MTDKKITMVDAPEMKVTEELGHLVIRFTEPVSFEKDNTITIELDKLLQTAITTAREGLIEEIKKGIGDLFVYHTMDEDEAPMAEKVKILEVLNRDDVDRLLSTLKGNHEK